MTKELRTCKEYLELQKECLESNKKDRLWYLLKEDTIKFDGMILFAWQCEIIEYEEWKKYKEYVWKMRKIAEEEIAENY